MRYIDKSKYTAPPAYVAELHAKQLDEATIRTGPHWGLSARTIFENHVKKLSSFSSMKDSLLKDQGYVCCYCNRRIEKKGYPVEHVTPKGSKKEWIGEYKNLLIACQGGNPTPSGYSKSTYPLHCDQSKGEDAIQVTPLMSDCERRFIYKASGKVEAKPGDNDADETIRKLNLNQRLLRIERRKEIQNWCLKADGTPRDVKQLEQVFYEMFKKDAAGKYHNLYFVIANVIMTLY